MNPLVKKYIECVIINQKNKLSRKSERKNCEKLLGIMKKPVIKNIKTFSGP